MQDPSDLALVNVTTADLPILRVGQKRYPIVLPSLRDPRLHLAAVIVTIHVLGQVALGFRVSVPQIVVAILTCAVIEVALTLRRTGRLVWPASAMLTGSGVALILRLTEAQPGDHWAWKGWYLFALVAALSIATKYVVRYRGEHLFNPSNVGLVVAFLVLGSSVVEPLDFWWGPLDAWMALAYVVILVGGLLITARLGLLAMAVAFWLTLTAGIGLLAASGHCITATWSLTPVCGSEFWWVVIVSPEILVFLFFMITDPRTIPRGTRARIAFAVCLALLSTLLIAPQSTEFGAKVALLGGLVLMSPLRALFDRLERSGWLELAAYTGGSAPWQIFRRGAVMGSALALTAAAIGFAGLPAREEAQPASDAEAFQMDVEVDPSALPEVTVRPEVLALNTDLNDGGAAALGLVLARNLEVESQALLRRDQSLLRGADSGQRLIDLQRKIEEATAAEKRADLNYRFDSLALGVHFSEDRQAGPSLGLEARGTVEEVLYSENGDEESRTVSPLASVFVLQQEGGQWLIVDTLDLP